MLIIAQSAATSRSFAMKHNQRVDVNRDIVGLSGANFAAGLTGTFVVNGSPTKTQILDEQKGRTQVANMTMSVVVLIVVLFLTGLLTDMPKAVLAAIVFLIGVGLIDIKGLRRILAARRSEFVIAAITAVVVFAVGVEQGIILAIVLSILEIIRRAYAPKDFLVAVDTRRRHDLRQRRARTPEPARAAGVPLRRAALLRQRQPVLRPGPRRSCRRHRPRCGGSSSTAHHSMTSTTRPASPSPDSSAPCTPTAACSLSPEPIHRLLETLKKYGTLTDFDNTHIYPTVADAVAAFRTLPTEPASQPL